jgi:hypothetical protein
VSMLLCRESEHPFREREVDCGLLGGWWAQHAS